MVTPMMMREARMVKVQSVPVEVAFIFCGFKTQAGDGKSGLFARRAGR